jgi:hypothetical protein
MCKTNAGTSEGEMSELPLFGKLFSASTALPQVNFPLTSLPISFLVLSTIFFTLFRIAVRVALKELMGFPDNKVTDAIAGRIASVVHSTMLVPGLLAAFMAHQYSPTEHISKAPNKKWQDLVDALLQYCTGYMLSDTISIVLYNVPEGSIMPSNFSPMDVLFLAHHVVTSTYMTQARSYKAGHMSAMMCMLLGELSNPVYNSHHILTIASGLDGCSGPSLELVKAILQVLFYTIFLSLRVIIGPIVCAHMTWDLLFSKQGRQNLPLVVRIFWSLMIWGVIIGSYSEICNCYELMTTDLNDFFSTIAPSIQQMSDDLPLYGKVLVAFFRSVPQFNFPFTGLPVSFVLVSAGFLVSVRLFTNEVLESVFGWPVGDVVTDRAASSVPAIVHSMLLCPGLIVAFMVQTYNPTEHISEASDEWQDFVNALLQFCTGYMLNDTLFLVYRAQQAAGSIIPKFEFGDILFLGHHAVTSIYMTQARVYEAGHMSAMMCMLLGEFSNPLHNTYFIIGIASGLECCKGAMLQLTQNIVPKLFAAVYILLRVIVAPPVMVYTTWDLVYSEQGKENLPFAIRGFWVFMIWAVMVGSIPEVMAGKDILLGSSTDTEKVKSS